MAEPASGAAVSRRWRGVALAAAAVAFLAAAGPVSVRLGANAEEAVGLLATDPERIYPDGVDAPDSELRDGPGLRSSSRLPVWGYVWGDGTFSPLMIDGHVGALTFYPARLLSRAGGLTAARLSSVAFGLAGLLLIYLLARRIAGERVALVAVALAAVSPHYAFAFSMVRPDEQLDSLAHVAALLALIRFADTRQARWFYVGCALLGFGVAAKNTAGWTLIGIAVAALLFGPRPRVTPKQWMVGALAFAAPLAPQLAFLLLGERTDAFSGRLQMLSAPWEGLAPGHLAFSVAHFADSVGHTGSLIGGYVTGNAWDWLIPGAGYLVLAGVLLIVATAFSNRQPTATRAFGAGLGVTLLLYWSLYYRGESYYLLLAPWIPIALALAVMASWNAARSPLARGVLLAVVAAVAISSIAESGRLQRASAAPASALFDRDAQQGAVDRLLREGIERPFVTTYGGVGVLELLSDGALRPRYLFPFFHQVSNGDRSAYTAAWRRALERIGPGAHTFVLVPNPSPVDTSPCEHGGYIAEQLRPAVTTLGGDVRAIAAWQAADGRPILELVRVTLP